MPELTVDELFDETMRLSDVLEFADRLVWMWRMTSYRLRCQDGTCDLSDPTPDPTVLVINFRDALIEGLGVAGAPDANLLKVAELLAVQTMKRSANIDLEAPAHLWAAAEDSDAHCSCGWSFPAGDFDAAAEAWEDHSVGSGLELPAWQLSWLEKFNV